MSEDSEVLRAQVEDVKETLIRFHEEDREDRRSFKDDISKEHHNIWDKINEVEKVAYTNIPPLTHYIQMGLVFLATSGIGTTITLLLSSKGR